MSMQCNLCVQIFLNLLLLLLLLTFFFIQKYIQYQVLKMFIAIIYTYAHLHVCTLKIKTFTRHRVRVVLHKEHVTLNRIIKKKTNALNFDSEKDIFNNYKEYSN